MSFKFEAPIAGIEQEQVLKLMSELVRESDRGMVLVCVAILDESVAAKIAKILSRGSKEAQSRLLDTPMGALSGFMSKVDFAYCIGLYNHHIYEDVRLLNRLRIKCAHEWLAFSLDDEVISKYVRPMHSWPWTVAVADLYQKNGRTLKNQELFGVTMACLITYANTAYLVDPSPSDPPPES